MAATADTPRYDGVAQALHWAVALLIVVAWLLPGIAEDLPPGPDRAGWIALHKSLGITVLALVIVRAAWRRFNPPPPLPAGTSPWLDRAALAGHALLYLLMLALPVVGIAMSWANGRPVAWFGLIDLPSPLVQDKALGHSLKEVHELLGNGILVVAGLHAAAALFHQYVLKDGVLMRMLPWRSLNSQRG